MSSLQKKVLALEKCRAVLDQARADFARLSRELIESLTYRVGPDGAVTDNLPARVSKPAAGPVVKPRTRAVITDATRASVKKLVQAGKTAAEIAKTLAISKPSVANIKKQLGLVNKKPKK